MGALESLSLAMGTAWTSGINLYATIAVLGIAGRAGMIQLPPGLQVLTDPLVIGIACFMYVIEFVVDKVPYLNNAWDSFHTFIRPVGGVFLGYLAMSNLNPAIQYTAALLTGAVALNSHLTASTARVALNSSPGVVTNPVASVSKDVSVATVLYFTIKHPVIACMIVIAFIIFSIWFLRTMFRFLRKLFKREPVPDPSTVKTV